MTPLLPRIKALPAVLILVCLVGGPVSCSRESSNQDKTVSVKPDDPDMTAAIASARASLPGFWKIFDHPEHGESDFCLKVKIEDKGEVEYFWLANIERQGGKIYGVISNEPEFVKSVKAGQRLEVNEADISDWMYTRDARLHGNYTLRALFKAMPKTEVDKYRALLADP